MGSSEALSNFIDVFIESINTQGLWATIGHCVPLIALSALFGLGVFMIIRVIRGIIKARGY